ncbi:MAG TPA: hypothetical protein VFH16_21395 [Rubrobacter sp.]|nr:hypothetical protein [Rubrobacter sp.]
MHHGREDHTQRPKPMRLLAAAMLSVSLSAGLLTSACGADTTAATKDKNDRTSTTAASSTTTDTAGSRKSKSIPQPLVPADIPVAPQSERVDLSTPTFSDPTNVTNPLFPVSKQDSVLMVGHVDGKPFRTEVTLLPETRIVEWQGKRIETLVSQYMAYLDGRIQEVAYDLYAQADDGSVWYFGEDVADFEDGAIVTKEGTWIVGKDGPAAMIMPADPKVGDAYRTENTPGIAFEEVTVMAVGKTLDGPLGPVKGGLLAEELHMDGKTEGKTFGPGYGEFYTSDGSDVEALALAVPTDALPGPLPDELGDLNSGALETFDAANSSNWNAASTAVNKMNAAWKTYRRGKVPKKVEPRINEALAALKAAVDARDAEHTPQAAIDVAQWSLDLRLQYRPQTEVDLARMDLWADQLTLDAAAREVGSVGGDVFTISYIRDRILNTLDGADVVRVDSEVQKLQVAVADDDLLAASEAAERLKETLKPFQE